MKKTELIKINGLEYTVTLIPADRKTIALRMISVGDLEVRFPRFIGRKRAIGYIYQKSRWIAKKHKLFETDLTTGAGKGIFEGRLLYCSGIQYEVAFGGDEIEINNSKILIPIGSSEEVLNEWYRILTENVVDEFIEKHGHEIPDCIIKVKKQKTIWGSCNSKRRIYINLKLSMCPEEVVDYVIWHEICHLTHMNHSKDFYSLLSQKCPSYKKHKAWLKTNSMFLKI